MTRCGRSPTGVQVRQLVVVGVGVVEEAVLRQDGARALARRVPRQPALRRLAPRRAEARQRERELLPLALLVEQVLAGVPPAVPEQVVPGEARVHGDLRVALERHRAGGDRGGESAVLEQPLQPPEPHATAVGHRRLGGEVAAEHLVAGAARIRQRSLALLEPVGQRILRPLLHGDGDVHRHPGLSGPVRVGTVASVADEVAHPGVSFGSPPSCQRRAPRGDSTPRWSGCGRGGADRPTRPLRRRGAPPRAPPPAPPACGSRASGTP